MISTSCNIAEFIEAVKTKTYSDMIRLAELEALEAWRISRKRREGIEGGCEDSELYESLLKELIYFVRSTVEVPRRGIPLELFRTARRLAIGQA